MATKTPAHGAEAAAAAPAALRLLHLLLAASVFLADRIAKILIETGLTLHEARPVIPGFFDIVHVRNQGIAFGLFADSPSAVKTLVLVLLSGAALAGVAYLLWTGEPTAGRQGIGLSLILGGAMGNLFDRVRQGGVVDFLDFFIGAHHWPAFNLADSAIVIGGGLLLLQMTRGRKGDAK